MKQIYASSTPKNVLTDPDVALAPNTKVQIQNKSSRYLMIFSGDAQPASLDDYFRMDGNEWLEFQSAVIYVWSDLSEHPLMVQEIA